MKKMFFTAMFSILLLFLIPLTNSCFNPADSFASEVVLNKPGIEYNLGLFLKGRNFLYENNQYIFQSQYSNRLATILSEPKEICETNCLSLKLQIPVESVNEKFPYFSIISSVIAKKNLIEDINYKGWNIFPGQKSMEFKKGQISILVSSIDMRHDVILEINEDLEDCVRCSGRCIRSSYKDACIPEEMKKDIEDVLRYFGLVKDFEDLFVNSRSVGGERTLSDLKPVTNKEIDWKEAMRQELVRLKSKEIISIENKDIEEIVRLSNAGNAGHNSRIVYSELDNKWEHYYEIPNALLVREINCNEFSNSKIPKNPLDFKGYIIPVYYLVPLIIALSLTVVLLLLFMLARTLAKKKSKKL